LQAVLFPILIRTQRFPNKKWCAA